MSYALPAGCRDARDLLIKAKTSPNMTIREFKDLPCVAIFHVDSAFRSKLDKNPEVSIPYLRMYGHVTGYRVDPDITNAEVFPNGDAEIITVGEDELNKESESFYQKDLYESDVVTKKPKFSYYDFSKTDREKARELVVDYQFDANLNFVDGDGVKQHINEFAAIFEKGWLEDNYHVTKLDRTEIEVPVIVTYTQCVDLETGDSVAVIKCENYAEMRAITSGYFNFTDMLDDIKDLQRDDFEDDFDTLYEKDEDENDYDVQQEETVEETVEETADYRTQEEIDEDELIARMSENVTTDYEARVSENEELKATRAKQTQEESETEKSEMDESEKQDEKDAGHTVSESESIDRERAVEHMAQVAGLDSEEDSSEDDKSFF